MRKRPRDLYTQPFFPQKYHRHRSVETEYAYFRVLRQRSEKFSSPKTSLTKKNASQSWKKWNRLFVAVSFSFSLSLFNYRSVWSEKSAMEKRLVVERLETLNFIENFARCLSRALRVSRLVCRELVRICPPEINSKQDVARHRKFLRFWHARSKKLRKYDERVFSRKQFHNEIK